MSSARFLPVLLITTLLSAPSLDGADGDPCPMIGWRYDGSGVAPADCRPPLQFSECGLKKEKDPHGRERDIPDPAQAQLRNIVWRYALPNGGNGSPIVVGERVYVVCEPGWGSDCPVLVCVDGESGTELWRAEIDQFASLPPSERQRCAEFRATCFADMRRMYQLAHEYNGADATRRQEIRAQLVAMDLGRLIKEGAERWGGFANQCALPFDRRAWRDVKRTADWVSPTWQYTCVGMTFPTPVSDGERIFVFTGYKAVAAFDLAGEALWLRWHREDPYPRSHATGILTQSPIIHGGRLICSGAGWAWCHDRVSGELLWKLDTAQSTYMCATPVRLMLQDQPCVFFPSGELVRIGDGKVLLERIGCFGGGAALIGNGVDTIYGNNGATGGGYRQPADRQFAEEGSIALRFVPGDGGVTVERLWQTDPKNKIVRFGEPCPLLHEGRLYLGNGAILDAGDGSVLCDRDRSGGYDQAGILVAGHVVGIGAGDGNGRVHLHTVDPSARNVYGGPTILLPGFDPGFTQDKTEQAIAMCGCPHAGRWYAWTFGRTVPFASGNRLFIRNFDKLYGIGDPSQPFRPSADLARRSAEPSPRGGGPEADDGEARAAEPEPAVDDAALRQALAAALAAGERPGFRMTSTRMDVQVVELEGDTLRLQGRGMDLRIPFARLGDGDLRALGRALER